MRFGESFRRFGQSLGGLVGAPLFDDRDEAGAQLARALERHRGTRPLVLGIPRGGVPVAAHVARALGGELDVIVARKLGSPLQGELAIGAVTSNGGRYLNDRLLRQLGVSHAYVERVTAEQGEEARRREALFRGTRAPLAPEGRTVIVVDDGLATGATMFAAVRSVRQHSPARLVVAVPVGSRDAVTALHTMADEVVCLFQPDPFVAIGLHYRDFAQTEDEEVQRLLTELRPPEAPAALSAMPAPVS